MMTFFQTYLLAYTDSTIVFSQMCKMCFENRILKLEVWSNKQLKQITFSKLYHSEACHEPNSKWKPIKVTQDVQNKLHPTLPLPLIILVLCTMLQYACECYIVEVAFLVDGRLSEELVHIFICKPVAHRSEKLPQVLLLDHTWKTNVKIAKSTFNDFNLWIQDKEKGHNLFGCL